MRRKRSVVLEGSRCLLFWGRIILAAVMIVMAGIYPVQASDVQNADIINENGDTVTSPKKIISVVYDDSGSMLGSDSGSGSTSAPGERWTNANYSLQTLTALLNTEDQLYVTYMSEPGTVVEKVVSSSQEIQKSVDEIRSKDDTNGTPEQAIDTAVQKLESVKDPEASTQYWLVIMTDGVISGFDQDEGMQDKIDSLKSKQMANGSFMYIYYFGMGNASDVKEDENSGLYSSTVTNDKIIEEMKTLANRISGRIEFDAANLSQENDTTIRVHSDLPLYSLSILSQASAARVDSAKAEGTLEVERNISLDAHDLSKGAKIDNLFGNAAVITNDGKPIYAGDYTVTFSEAVDLKNLVVLYEPALEFNIIITKDGIRVDDPDTLAVDDKIEVEIIPVIPGTDTQIADDVLPKGITFGVEYVVDDKVIKESASRSLTDVQIQAGKNVINTQMQIPGFIPITKQVAMFQPVEQVDYSLDMGKNDGNTYDRAKLKSISGEDIQFWLSGNGQHLTKEETKDIKLTAFVENVDKSGITETGFKGFLNRFGFNNAKIKIVQQKDGSYILKPVHPLAIAPFATHAGVYTVRVELKGDTAVTSEVTFTVVPGMQEWFWVIVCILVIFFVIYVIDILFFKHKFHGQVVYYTQYKLKSDGSGSLQAGQGDSKKLPFLTPNLLIPFVTRSATVSFQGIKLVADGSVVKIPGKVVKESVYAYGRSSDNPERHLGRIVRSMKVFDKGKGKQSTMVPDVVLNRTKTYFKNGEKDKVVWAFHIEE